MSTTTAKDHSQKNLSNPKKLVLTEEEIKKLTELKDNEKEYLELYNSIAEKKVSSLNEKKQSEYVTMKLLPINQKKRVVGRTNLIELVHGIAPPKQNYFTESDYENKGGKKQKKNQKIQPNLSSLNAIISVSHPIVESLLNSSKSAAEIDRRKTISKKDVEVAILTHFPPELAKKYLDEMNPAYEKYMESMKDAQEDSSDDEDGDNDDDDDDDDDNAADENNNDEDNQSENNGGTVERAEESELTSGQFMVDDQ